MNNKSIIGKVSKYKTTNRVALAKELNPLTKTAICNICGKRRKMSRDHVPLKALGNSGVVVIKSHHKRFNIKEVKAQNGIAFKTICSQCNSLLGTLYDKPLNDFLRDIKKYADCVFKTILKLPRYAAEFETVPSHLARSVIGHMLASKIHHKGPYLKELRAFILEPLYTLPKDLHLYVWFYCDYKTKVLPEYVIPILAKDVELLIFYIIKSYPCAFVLTNSQMTGTGIVDLLAITNDTRASITIDLLNHPHPNWPEAEFVATEGQTVLIGANNFNAIET
jgi:hypothetical protein